MNTDAPYRIIGDIVIKNKSDNKWNKSRKKS